MKLQIVICTILIVLKLDNNCSGQSVLQSPISIRYKIMCDSCQKVVVRTIGKGSKWDFKLKSFTGRPDQLPIYRMKYDSSIADYMLNSDLLVEALVPDDSYCLAELFLYNNDRIMGIYIEDFHKYFPFKRQSEFYHYQMYRLHGLLSLKAEMVFQITGFGEQYFCIRDGEVYAYIGNLQLKKLDDFMREFYTEQFLRDSYEFRPIE